MQITGQTKIVGIIGDPIKHSRSPQIHNAAITALGLDYVYVAFHVQPDNLGAAIEGFKATNVVGINVTIPHKQNVISYLDEISREATLIGAVNTLIFKDGGIIGENTDAPGFLQAMEEAGLDVPQGGSAVIIGAGGSARAVVVCPRSCRDTDDLHCQSYRFKSGRACYGSFKANRHINLRNRAR